MAFQFAGSLVGHRGDIRAVAGLADGTIVTASRDITAKRWVKSSRGVFDCASTLEGHTGYVNAIAVLQATEDHPSGLIVTGSLDKTILVYDPLLDNSPIAQLTGHENAVVSLAAGPNGSLISGSWDFTSIVWESLKPKHVLKGHTKAVWRAISHPSTSAVLTASADTTIRQWTDGVTTHTYTGHTGVVRDLAFVSETTFVSASNDSSIRVWEFGGSCTQTLLGHASFVYSICSLGDGRVASSGEDSCVKVWSLLGEGLVQTIDLPCVSVWSVATLPSGDLAIGCDDATARVFSENTEHIAPDELLIPFNELVAAHVAARTSTKVGALDKTTLPGRDALRVPGTKAGDTKLVLHGGKVEAYAWDSSKQVWEYTGEVTDAVEDDQATTFVIEIDGKQLKMPHKHKDNPYVTAQNFIMKNELDYGYLDQIAKFIIDNSATPTIEAGPPMHNPDPFTGGHAYVPMSQSSSAPSTVSYSDPFTGGHAYKTAAATQQTHVPPKSAPSFFPNSRYVRMDKFVLDPIIAKLNELNQREDIERLTSEHLVALLSLFTTLSDPNQFNNEHTELPLVLDALQIITCWPTECLLPGLDLLRIIVLCEQAKALMASHPYFGSSDSFYVKLIALSSGNPSGAAANNQMLALRFFANTITTSQCPLFPLIPQLCTALSAIEPKSLKKPAVLALSTVLLNLAALFRSTAAFVDCEMDVIQCIYKVLEAKIDDEETLFRTLVAIGTLVYQNANWLEAFKSIPDIAQLLLLYSSHASAKVSKTAKELAQL